MNEPPKCEVCGEPMPPGEEMFMYHGYSGPCPKPPLARERADIFDRCKQMVVSWRAQATKSREEANRLRLTINDITVAWERCCTRSEVWEQCAQELEEVLSKISK